jgi:hypothetical protein
MDKQNKITKEAAEKWIELLKERNGLCDQGFNEEAIDDLAGLLFTESLQKIKTDTIAMTKLNDSNALVVFGPNMAGFDADYVYEKEEEISFCRLSHTNAVLLRKLLPFTAPSPLSEMDITFGLGDRLGIASPGHIRLFKDNNACPVLAQQSVRELELTARTYEDVLDAATWAVFQECYDLPWGADGDHLKTEEWVKKALDIGFTMITADVSDYIRKEYDALDDAAVMEAYEKLDPQYREDIEKRYLSLSIELDTGDTISFTKQELAKIALIYKDAVEHAVRLYETGIATEQPFDFEFSIDETETPTLAQAHVFTASEAIKNKIKISSLAPRFIGEFQKGIDYIGNKDEFEKAFKVHAAIARHFGYRISVHSGSDKFMVFPIIGRETQGRFHIKTPGTNWLQAVEVIAQQESAFFRKLYAYALEVFPIAKQYYHITPNMDNLPNLDEMNDEQLPSIFTNNDARQVVHVTYGEILRNPEFKDQIYSTLNEHIEAYWLSLEKHIGKHLELLGVE